VVDFSLLIKPSFIRLFIILSSFFSLISRLMSPVPF
jgi:hypothetical protein